MFASRSLVLVALALAAACSLPQAPECEQYIACQEAYDEAFGIEPKTETSDYAPEGRCWFGNVETAAACTASCEDGVAALDEAATLAGQPLSACGG